MKKPEWNTAIEGDEDWKAAISSEIFREFVKMSLNKTGIFAKENKYDEYDNESKDEQEEGVKQPLMRNKDYVSANDYIDQLIAEAEESIPEVEDFEVGAIDVDSDGEIDYAYSVGVIDEETNEYETGAGESQFIDIGLSDGTMNDIKNDGIMSGAIKDVMNVYVKEELNEAEEELGLNANAAYIFNKRGE
jgi:hypothetical protein